MDRGTAPASDGRLIGRSLQRQEDPRLLRGAGRYVGDVTLPGMLHMGVLRSPHAHARIGARDFATAARHPDVVAVLGADEVSACAWLPVFIEPPGARQASYPILPRDRVLYVGQPVAAVVATSASAAADALEAMRVVYEPLPAVIDVDAAMAPDAPRLHDGWPDNVAARREILTGDPEPIFAAAPVVVEGSFTTPRHAAAPMEGRAVLASYESATAELTVWVSSQAPHLYRTVLAAALGIEENRVVVIVPDVGGGFGVKLHYYPEDVLTALAAMRLARPVRWIETRSEGFVGTVHARQQRIRARAAFDARGVLQAVKAHVRGDVGAHLHTKGPAPIFTTGVLLPGPYAVPHYRARIEAIVTNKTPFGAYRAFGQQQGAFVMERLMDLGAARLGLDPAEIRRRNLVPPDAFPYRSAGGWEYDSGRYADGLALALACARYEELRAWQARERAHGRLLGIGLACYVEFTGMGPSRIMAAMGNRQGGYETAVVSVDPSGHATVTSGIIEIGQGIRSAMAQIAADVLGLRYEHVRVVLGHTGRTPYSAYGTAGSRGAVVAGGAVLEAARRVRAKATRIAAHLLEAAEADVTVIEGRYVVRGAPASGLSLADIAREAHRGQRLPEGTEPGLEARHVHEPRNWTFSSGVHVAAVDVDRETGAVRIIGYWIAHDCGPVINPLLVEGQVHGGVAQGVGAALMETLVYDADGQLLTRTFMDYALPIAASMPAPVLEHLETPSPHTPGGVKGMSEGGTIAPPAAIANAVGDALAGLGIDPALVDRYPLTAPVVFGLLDGATMAALGTRARGAPGLTS